MNKSAETLHHRGGQITVSLYPAMGHTISQDEIDAVRDLMDKLPLRSEQPR